MAISFIEKEFHKMYNKSIERKEDTKMKKILSMLIAFTMVIAISLSASAQCPISNLLFGNEGNSGGTEGNNNSVLYNISDIAKNYNCKDGNCETDSSCPANDLIKNVINNLVLNQGGANSENTVNDILNALKNKSCIFGNCENDNADNSGNNNENCENNNCNNGISEDEKNCEDGNCPEYNVPEDKAPEEDKTPEVSYSSYALEVIRLVNVERAKYGLSELTYTDSLMNAANKRAVEQETVFSHTRPNGTSCFTVLQEYGISYSGAGENIAMGQRTPVEVVNAWMNSQGHRENILNANFTKIGVGCYLGSNGTYYWSQLFTY